MTITNGYSTVTEYKTWIAVRGLSGSVGTDTSDDSAIELLIECASRYIDRETSRKFYADSNDVTRYYKAVDSQCVYIDELSAAPTSLSVDLTNTGVYTVMASTEYDLLPNNALADGQPYSYVYIKPYSSSYFPTQNRGIKIIGKFGFPSVPADIKEACLLITQSVYGSRSGQTAGGKITVTAAGVVIRPEEVPALAQKIIMHWRNLV